MKLLLTILSVVHFLVLGQNPITLQSCLEKAQMNKQLYAPQTALVLTSEKERKFHKWSLLPNLTASTGFNVSFGRRLDPFTNTFATTSVNSQTIGLNSSVQLFSGFNYIHVRNILNVKMKQSELSVESRLNEIIVQVSDLYLEICKLSKQLEFATVRIEKYRQIQYIQRLLVNEGKINAIDTLRSHNSLMNEDGLLISLKSDVSLKMIELNYLIGEPLLSEHAVVLESVIEIKDKPKLSQSFALAQLESDQAIADQQYKADRSSFLPNLSLNGLLGTGFSTNNKNYNVEGNPTRPYFDQVNQNLYEGIGFYLNIPIFNRGALIKSKQLYEIRNQERETTKEQVAVLLQKQQVELSQKLLRNKAEQLQTQQITDNLQTIYEKMVLLYKEGRTTYTELETAFIDWQTKLIALEALKLDGTLLLMYE